MPYHQIIVYVREGDTLRAYRRSRYWSGSGWAWHTAEIHMSDLFHGHTQWVGEQVNPPVSMRKAA